MAESNSKSWIVCLLLCLFGRVLGLHRFYVGKIGSGVGMIFTFGGLGIWWLIDLIKIICKKFTDKQGNTIE